jgi:mRNA interferase RelE/StbE
MSYELIFHPKALKEWKKLPSTIKTQLKKKISKRLYNPRIIADKLQGAKNRYKIKLRASGYRLVYDVVDKNLCIIILIIDNRDVVYSKLDKRH